MRYLVVLLALMVANVVQAMDCRENPDCTRMGYSTASDPNCKENGYIYCPFDQAYKKCVNMNCEALGFTKDDKSSWCGKIVSCRGDKRFTACKALCEVGDVYYDNGTCGYVDDYDPNDKTKTPVGVVVTVNAEGTHGKILALNDLTLQDNYTFDEKNPFGGSIKEIPFGGYYYERTGAHSYLVSNILSPLQSHEQWLWDGLNATKAAAEITGSERNMEKCESEVGETYKVDKTYHDKFCKEPTGPKTAMAFYPEGVSKNDAHLGKGKWYIPSLGEWIDVVGTEYTISQKSSDDAPQPSYTKVHFDKIASTLSALQQKNKAQTFADTYWSSTMFDSKTFWRFLPQKHEISWAYVFRNFMRIRPMTTF